MSDTSAPGSGQSLGIGQIISESFSLAFSNFFKLLAVIIVPYVIMGIAAYLLIGQMFDPAVLTDPFAMNQLMADPGFLAMYILFLVISLFITSFMLAAGIKLFFDAKTSGAGNLGAAFSVGFSRAVQLFVAMLVLYLILVVGALVLGAIMGAVVAMIQVPAVGIVLGIGLAVVMLWFMGVILPFSAIPVLENRWVSAIGRTRFWKIAGFRL